ncbi:Ribosomal RNA small subunit methyltransferase NEP1 [Glycine soja]|nr:Ribosomal RNA small subunit methyltransferase NEP1 [Glycine soja]
MRSPAIFILDNASLKKGLVKKALRCILDSPLNKAGMVGAIYVKMDQRGVFEVKPHVRIPRTCNRFCGVIILLRVVEEPITRHLPVNSHIVGLSYTSEKLVDIEEYVSVWSNDLSPVFVVGTMVNGKVKGDYMHDYISISEYPLAAKYCLGMICEAL